VYEDNDNWFEENLKVLAQDFYPEDLELITSGEKTILIIYNFPLPDNFEQTETDLMIIFPEGDRLLYAKPDKFYADKGLKLRDSRTPPHIFESIGFNDRSNEGWARLSIHLKEWHPTRDVVSGSNITDILESIYNGLKDLR